MMIAANRSRRIVIAGANELGQTLAAKLTNSARFGMTIDGFFDDRSAERLGGDSNVSIIGKLLDLPDYVRKNNIDVIFSNLGASLINLMNYSHVCKMRINLRI